MFSVLCTDPNLSYPLSYPPSLGLGLLSTLFRHIGAVHYYEGSDSWTLSPQRSGLPTYCAIPSYRSTSNHSMYPTIALPTTTAWPVSFRFRHLVEGSSLHAAESSSSSCGPTVRLQLLLTPSHDDAITFSYGAVAYSDTDLHRVDTAPSWAHD